MLTKEDLKAIGDLIDKKLDEKLDKRFVEFEKKMDEKLDGLYKVLSERMDRMEARIAKQVAEIHEILDDHESRLKD